MNQMRVNFLEIGRRIPFLPLLLKGRGGGSFLWPADSRWKTGNISIFDWSTISFRTLKAVNRRPKRLTSFR